MYSVQIIEIIEIIIRKKTDIREKRRRCFYNILPDDTVSQTGILVT